MADRDIAAAPGKPKRPRKSRRQDALDALHALTTEGGGLCALAFYSRDDILSLKERAVDGDPRAWNHFHAIGRIVQALSARRPPICALCRAVLNEDEPPELIAVLQAYCDNPTHIISNAICARCAAEHPTQAALRAAIVGFYREHVDADLRVLPSAQHLPRLVWRYRQAVGPSRGGIGTHHGQRGGAGVCAERSVRAATRTDGRLGELPRAAPG